MDARYYRGARDVKQETNANAPQASVLEVPRANFSERRLREVRRKTLPRTSVNKAAHKLETPSRSGGCSRVD